MGTKKNGLLKIEHPLSSGSSEARVAPLVEIKRKAENNVIIPSQNNQRMTKNHHFFPIPNSKVEQKEVHVVI